MYLSHPTNRFLDDNFTIPMVLSYLSDKDALQNLLVCGKELKPAFDNYSIKSSIHASKIIDLMTPNNYISFGIFAVKELDKIDQLVLLPKSVRTVYFSNHFNQPLGTAVFPQSLTDLTFGDNFNQPLQVGIFPSSLSHLDFGWDFDQPLEVGVIPSSVTNLSFGYAFDQPLEVGIIPTSVTNLTFGVSFNQALDVGSIPSCITHLEFGYYFNQPLEVGVIPSSVTHLTFGARFNKPLDIGVIPSSVTHITFGDFFNQPIGAGIIPSFVTDLAFGHHFNQTFGVGSLPSSLQQLVVDRDFTRTLPVGVVPSTIRSIRPIVNSYRKQWRTYQSSQYIVVVTALQFTPEFLHSAAAYSNTPQTCLSSNYFVVDQFNSSLFDTHVFGFVSLDQTNKNAYISFRGTDNLDQLYEEILHYRPISVSVNSSIMVNEFFWKSVQLLKPKLLEIWNKYDLFRFKRIYTGHSLGGALAIVMAYVIEKDTKYNIVTFGSPRVSTLLGLNHTLNRFVNGRDLIPHLPPQGLYTHDPREIWMYNNETKYCDNNNGEDVQCSNSLQFYDISDHLYYYGVRVGTFCIDEKNLAGNVYMKDQHE